MNGPLLNSSPCNMIFKYDILHDLPMILEKCMIYHNFHTNIFSRLLAFRVLHQYEYASLHFDSIYDSNMDTV